MKPVHTRPNPNVPIEEWCKCCKKMSPVLIEHSSDTPDQMKLIVLECGHEYDEDENGDRNWRTYRRS